MNNLVRVRAAAPPATVIKKLIKDNINFYSLKKEGANTTFAVKSKTLKKVFAIFAHPCYNVCVIKYGAVRTLMLRAAARAGLVFGAVLFAAAVSLSQVFVLGIKVEGSGAHLRSEVACILSDCGVVCGRPCPSIRRPQIISRVMALPGVTFCSVERRGSSVVVNVQCGGQSTPAATYSPLICPVSGVVEEVVVICGTPTVSVGDSVQRGAKLILAQYTPPGGESAPCLPVGRVAVRVEASLSTCALAEDEDALAAAYAAVNLWAEDAKICGHTVKRASGGVIYTVNFSYLYTASVNMQ